MTRNAAHLLADLLEAYRVPANTSPDSVRGFTGTADVNEWRRYVHALSLVRNVDDKLRELEADGHDVEFFQRSLGAWYAGIGLATTPWGTTVNSVREACEPQHVNLLRALGMTIDARGSINLDESDQRRLKDVIEEARELLKVDNTVPSDMRAYLANLLDRASFLLTNLDQYGPETLRATAMEMAGAMVHQGARAEAAGDAPTAGRWHANADAAMAGFFGGFGGEGASALMSGAGEVAKAIIGG